MVTQRPHNRYLDKNTLATAAAAIGSAPAAPSAPLTLGELLAPAALLPMPYAFRSALRMAVRVYSLLIIIWAVMSWIDHSQGIVKDIYSFLDALVSPYINLFKRFIPPIGNMDISPVVAIFVLNLVLWL